MDVRMPDGTVIRNVPDGTTKSELQRKLSATTGGGRNNSANAVGGLGEIARVDDDWDDSGIPNAKLRADVSRGDTPQEREMILGDYVGKENILRDSRGNLGITPAGAKRLGLDRSKPSLIDEPSFSRYDVADLRGDALPIAAGVGMGIATAGLGLPAAAMFTALGTGGAKMFDEAADQVSGRNLQPPGEVFKDVGGEMALAATGEAGGRFIAGAVNKVLRPGAKAFPEVVEQHVKESLERGIVPRIDNVKHSRIVKRMHSFTEFIFGDRNAKGNSLAIVNEMGKLRKAFNETVMPSAQDLGRLIRKDVIAAKALFKERASELYGFADDVLNGEAAMDLTHFKRVAADVEESFAKSGGQPTSLTESGLTLLKKIKGLDDKTTFSGIQGLRADLRSLLKSQEFNPGLGDHRIGILSDALESTFDKTAASVFDESTGTIGERYMRAEALKQVKIANRYYRMGMKKFDAAEIQKIAKREGTTGALDGSRIVDDFVLPNMKTPGSKKISPEKLNRILRVLPKSTREKVKSKAVDRILASMQNSDNPLEEIFFDPKKFGGMLDAMGGDGDEGLKLIFGDGVAKELRILQRSIRLATKQKGSNAGLIAVAQVALRPLQNLGTFAKLGVMRMFLSDKRALQWMTTGFRTGPKQQLAIESVSRILSQYAALAENDFEGSASESIQQLIPKEFRTQP